MTPERPLLSLTADGDHAMAQAMLVADSRLPAETA
jgi:hypothetical protein